MAQNPQDEKIAAFRGFAKAHPKLLEEVRNHKRSWQEIYEEWDIFGEDHEIWKDYVPDQGKGSGKSGKGSGGKTAASSQSDPESTKKGKPSLKNLLSMLEKIDYDKVQNNIDQISGAMDMAQNVLQQFQKKDTTTGSSGNYPGGNQPGPFGPQGYGPYGPQGFGTPRPPMFGPPQNRPPYPNQNH